LARGGLTALAPWRSFGFWSKKAARRGPVTNATVGVDCQRGPSAFVSVPDAERRLVRRSDMSAIGS
jgi:hypothetical protein